MLVSYVLRLVAAEAAQGRIVGELEDVQAGTVHRIRSVVDLTDAVRNAHPSGLGPLGQEEQP